MTKTLEETTRNVARLAEAKLSRARIMRELGLPKSVVSRILMELRNPARIEFLKENKRQRRSGETDDKAYVSPVTLPRLKFMERKEDQ